MMNIIDIINVLYPNAIAEGKVDFRNPDGELLIANWLLDVPKPTEQELLDLQGTEGFQELIVQKEVEEHNAGIRAQLDVIDLKSIRAIRDNDTEYLELYTQQAADLRAQLIN